MGNHLISTSTKYQCNSAIVIGMLSQLWLCCHHHGVTFHWEPCCCSTFRLVLCWHRVVWSSLGTGAAYYMQCLQGFSLSIILSCWEILKMLQNYLFRWIEIWCVCVCVWIEVWRGGSASLDVVGLWNMATDRILACRQHTFKTWLQTRARGYYQVLYIVQNVQPCSKF